MKNLLLPLACILCIGMATAQDTESTQIQQWQSLHPSTVLISQARYDALSKEAKQHIGENYILFSQKITLDQLVAFDNQSAQKDNNIKPANEISPAEAQFVKDWLGDHQDIQIYVRSEYETLTEEEKVVVKFPEYLILQTEEITKHDILLYENH